MRNPNWRVNDVYSEFLTVTFGKKRGSTRLNSQNETFLMRQRYPWIHSYCAQSDRSQRLRAVEGKSTSERLKLVQEMLQEAIAQGVFYWPRQVHGKRFPEDWKTLFAQLMRNFAQSSNCPKIALLILPSIKDIKVSTSGLNSSIIKNSAAGKTLCEYECV